MLSLSPRFDLFHFQLPRDYFPEIVLEKYQKIINKNQSVIIDPVNYINESIMGITVPGISDLNIAQNQPSHNSIRQTPRRINIEPIHENYYHSSTNPVNNIEKEFKITFRQNQGLYNYFMMYETIFYRICKPSLYSKGSDVFTIELLDDKGSVSSKLFLMQPLVSGIDGLEFSYSKTDRELETFDVMFNFNNINFDFVDNLVEENNDPKKIII